MGLPCEPVSLSAEQVGELNDHLSTMRHAINNHLTVMSIAAELALSAPDTAPQRMSALLKQVPEVKELLKTFSVEFERALGISKP
jgi:hypothetical protein